MRLSATFSAAALCAALAIAGTTAIADEKYRPATPGDLGQRVFDELGAYYKSKKNYPRFQDALAKFKSKDSAERAEVAKYILALFKQAWEDEKDERSPWVSTPYWGGRSECRAREFRKWLAEEFAKKGETTESIEIVKWLLDVEKLSIGQMAAAKVLCRVDAPESLEIKREILAKPYPNSTVVATILKDAGEKKTKELEKEVLALAISYKSSVRNAAVNAAEKMGTTSIPPFEPEKAFSPYLDKELRKIASLVTPQIPENAKWMVFRMKQGKDGGNAKTVSGWMLDADTDTDAYRVMDWFGRIVSIPKNKVESSSEKKPAEVAAEVAEIASKGCSGRAALSYFRAFSAQFEPKTVSIPEGLLGAWCYVRGDKKSAAKVIFPAYDRADVDDWVFMIVRDLLGKLYHQKMLREFSIHRDYEATLKLARHLSKPVFDGFQYQERAKELAERIPKRIDDFKTLALPTPKEWEVLKQNLSRKEIIASLADRLRLLNCVQHMQPGNVNLFDKQYRESPAERLKMARDGKTPTEVVNPYAILIAMGLIPADVKTLAPLLLDKQYIPTFSYWRDFHPKRNLYRVAWLVADIINDSACENLVAGDFFQQDEKEQKKRVDAILKWCDENADLTRIALMERTLRSTDNPKTFLKTASMAVKEKRDDVYPSILENAGRFPEHLEETEDICLEMDGDVPELLDAARKWLENKSPSTRFRASMILLKHNAPGCLAEVAKAVDAKDGDRSFFHAKAVEALLENGSPEALKLADSMPFPEMEPRTLLNAALQRLFLAGRGAALEFILKELSDETKTGHKAMGDRNGKPVSRETTRADNMAEILDAWSRYKLKYEAFAPEKTRNAIRDKATEWVKKQFENIKAGKKPDMNTATLPIFQSHWQVDAP